MKYMISLPSKLTLIGHDRVDEMMTHLHNDVPIEILGQKYFVMGVSRTYGATAARIEILEIELECVL